MHQIVAMMLSQYLHRRTRWEAGGLQPPSIWEFGQIRARFKIFLGKFGQRLWYFWSFVLDFWAIILFFSDKKGQPLHVQVVLYAYGLQDSFAILIKTIVNIANFPFAAQYCNPKRYRLICIAKWSVVVWSRLSRPLPKSFCSAPQFGAVVTCWFDYVSIGQFFCLLAWF